MPPFWTRFDLPRRHGEIESIRVLHERFCAFVNFKSASMAARAMEKLHVSVPAGWIWLSPALWRVAACSDRCFVSLAGFQHREHPAGRALPRPSPAQGTPHPTEDVRPCHAAGRGGCQVSTVPLAGGGGDHLSSICLTFPPLCPARGDAARSTETSVTSGEQPAAISGTSAATNTFQTRKARTGNPGSPELRHHHQHHHSYHQHHQHHHIGRDSSDAFACWTLVSPELTLTLRGNNQSEQNDQHLSIQVWMQWKSGMSLSNSHVFWPPWKNKTKQRALRSWNWI